MTQPDASERAILVELLTNLGVAEADMPDNLEDFAPLASDVVLNRGNQYSLRELAESGEGIESISEFLNHLGIKVNDVDEIVFNADDKILTDFVSAAVNEALLPSEGTEILHVVGTAMESLAEAAIASHVQGPERRSANVVDAAQVNAKLAELGLRLGDQLPVIFRHHLRQATQRQRRTQSQYHPEQVHLAVGFVDLVGFTSLSQDLSPSALVELVKHFEAHAHDLAHVHHARVVKLIGDEVMFVAENAIAAAGYGIGMLDAFDGSEVTPRGGMAIGALINLHGDYFGPVVNLAARLVNEAVPGELLVSEKIATSEGIESEPAGRRNLRGFGQPVRVATLLRGSAIANKPT